MERGNDKLLAYIRESQAAYLLMRLLMDIKAYNLFLYNFANNKSEAYQTIGTTTSQLICEAFGWNSKDFINWCNVHLLWGNRISNHGRFCLKRANKNKIYKMIFPKQKIQEYGF